MRRLLGAEVKRFHLDRLDFPVRLQVKHLDVTRGEGDDAGGSPRAAAQSHQTFSTTITFREEAAAAAAPDNRAASVTFGL